MLAGLVAGCASAPGKTSAPPVLPQASAPPPAASPRRASRRHRCGAGRPRAPAGVVRGQPGPLGPPGRVGGLGPRSHRLLPRRRRALGPASRSGGRSGPAPPGPWPAKSRASPSTRSSSAPGRRRPPPRWPPPGSSATSWARPTTPAMPTASELTLEQAWPGVDVVWSGTGGHIEATYRLAPGADPAQVRVAWRGAESVAVTAEGRLGVTTPVRSFEEDAPKAFQDIDGQRVPVEVAYDLDGAGTYGFRLGAYDPARPLVIDPTVLVYAGFLGGGGNDVRQRHRRGRGRQRLRDGPDQLHRRHLPGDHRGVPGRQRLYDSRDAFVAKVNPTGSALVYASFLGGSGSDVRQRHRRGRGRQRLRDRRHHPPPTPSRTPPACSRPIRAPGAEQRRLRGQGEPRRLGPGLRQLPGRQRRRRRLRHRGGRGRQRLRDRRDRLHRRHLPGHHRGVPGHQRRGQQRRLRGQGEPHRLGPGLRQLPGRQRRRLRPGHRGGRGRQRLRDRPDLLRRRHASRRPPGCSRPPTAGATTPSWPR